MDDNEDARLLITTLYWYYKGSAEQKFHVEFQLSFCLICVKWPDSTYKPALRHLISSDSVASPHCSNMRPTLKCWEVTVIVKSASGACVAVSIEHTHTHCMFVSIRAEALTHVESIMSAVRLHANYEQHQQMTACTYGCFTVSCPYAIMHLSLRWGHLGLCAAFLY